MVRKSSIEMNVFERHRPNTHLVLREHRGKSIGGKAHVSVGLSKIRRLLLGLGVQHGQVLRGENLSSHVKGLCRLLRNKQVVSGHHLYAYSVRVGILNGLLRIGTGGIQECQEAKHFPFVLSVLQIHFSHRKSSNTHLTETDNFSFDLLFNFGMSITHQVEENVGCALSCLELLAGFGVTNGPLGTFDGRIKREEILEAPNESDIISE